MTVEPLFKGLVVDEYDRVAGTATIGTEPCYVIDDSGFKRHIPSRPLDLQVLKTLGSQVEGNEQLFAEQASKMMGQEDIFTRAILANQLKNMDQQFEILLNTGFPEESRAFLGLMGFKVTIDMHGEILKIDQPAAPPDEHGGEQ